jgi:hypothetical protein
MGTPSARQDIDGVITTAISGGLDTSEPNQARNKTYPLSAAIETRTTLGLLQASPFPVHVSEAEFAGEGANPPIMAESTQPRYKARLRSRLAWNRFLLPAHSKPRSPKGIHGRINIMVTITSTVSIQFWASDLWVPRHGPVGLTLPKRDW